MIHINVKLHFCESGYIGLPYWPERNTLINIMKEVHPKLAETKKQAAIAAACEKRGISLDELKKLEALAARPFYTDDGTRTGEIVIPQRVFQSFLNNTSQECPKAVPRISAKGLTFIGVRLLHGFLRTGKTEADALRFERFVKMEESNQRTFSSSLYVTDFIAKGVIQLDEEVIKSADLRKLIEYGGRWYGIGSARPQGFGRFAVTAWDEAATLAATA
jgi:hypothetical protein